MLISWLQERNDKDTAMDDSVKKRKEVESGSGVAKEHATDIKVRFVPINLPVFIVRCFTSVVTGIVTYSKG